MPFLIRPSVDREGGGRVVACEIFTIRSALEGVSMLDSLILRNDVGRDDLRNDGKYNPARDLLRRSRGFYSMLRVLLDRLCDRYLCCLALLTVSPTWLKGCDGLSRKKRKKKVAAKSSRSKLSGILL